MFFINNPFSRREVKKGLFCGCAWAGGPLRLGKKTAVLFGKNAALGRLAATLWGKRLLCFLEKTQRLGAARSVGEKTAVTGKQPAILGKRVGRLGNSRAQHQQKTVKSVAPACTFGGRKTGKKKKGLVVGTECFNFAP